MWYFLFIYLIRLPGAISLKQLLLCAYFIYLFIMYIDFRESLEVLAAGSKDYLQARTPE
jgi:hypothetical protein